MLPRIEALEDLTRGDPFGRDDQTAAVDAAVAVPSTTTSATTQATSDSTVSTSQPATVTDPADVVTAPVTVDRSLNTLGITVWLLRAWILLIDIMSIVFKISLSLRSRRPYDALVAAREETSIVTARKIVDDALPRPRLSS